MYTFTTTAPALITAKILAWARQGWINSYSMIADIEECLVKGIPLSDDEVAEMYMWNIDTAIEDGLPVPQSKSADAVRSVLRNYRGLREIEARQYDEWFDAQDDNYSDGIL